MKRHWKALFLVAALFCSCVANAQTFKSDDDIAQLGYKQVYSFLIPNNPNLSNGAVYKIDNTGTTSGMIESIAYRVNLGADNYAFISMDAFTQNPKLMGVPTLTSGAVFQKYVGNLYYEAKSPNLTTAGTSVNQGNIEFWPTNYSSANGAGIPNANNDTYDFGDTRTAGDHGSMQIHDYQNSQVVFAFNNWNTGKNGALGIGNNANGSPDWTFMENVNGYETKTIDVYAKPVTFAATGDKLTAIQSDMANMSLAYKYIIPTNNVAGIIKSIDNSDNGTLAGMPIKRVGYYYELTDKSGNSTYAYASFDSLTNDVAKIGMPLNDGSWYHQSGVNNMTVVSNSANVTNGTGLTGNVEIWAGDYNQQNSANVPGANASFFDFGDNRSSTVGHGSFQIHNTNEGQTVFAINRWRDSNPETGIGNSPGDNKDWTFNQCANTYSSAKLLVMAEPSIAPMMTNVANASDYTLLQGTKVSQYMNTNLHSLTDDAMYNICNNTQSFKDSGKLFDRVGYYMEYAATPNDPLTYVFVSFDAQTTDAAKIGIPTLSSGIFYQQTVKNLEITSNVTAAQGILTDGAGNQVTAGQTYSFDQGYLEFWPSNYGAGKSGIVSSGSGAVYDINDSGMNKTNAEHGSMQIHNLTTGETVFSLSGLNQTKQYGIGTNPQASTTNTGPQKDWTFANQSSNPDISKTGYKIANVYTFVHEVDALLTTQDYTMFQRSGTGIAQAELSGTWAAVAGKSIDLVQASADGGATWIPMTINADGTFSGTITLDSGYHNVTYQALDASGAVMTSTSGRIGVGEIFITAGQSNSTNCGDVPQSSTSGNAWSYNFTTGKWQVANDPQPITINGQGDGSTRGSTWPSFADAMSEQLGVPVGVVCVGWGGSSIAQWNPTKINTNADGWEDLAFKPGDQTLFGRMALAIDTLDGKFAGILWHQGESDAGNTKERYQAALEALIEASRDKAGWDVPWSVALASCNSSGQAFDQIIQAQLAVIEGDALVFLGPNTDELDRVYRGLNGNSIHLSELGLDWTGATLWTASARDMLGVPEPSTWALLLVGALGLVWFRKRNRR